MNRTREERKRLYVDAAQIIRERGLLQDGNYAKTTGERCIVGALLEANGNESFQDSEELSVIHFTRVHDIIDDGVLAAEVTRKIRGRSETPLSIFRWNDDLDPETATDTAATLLEDLAKDLG